MSLSHSLTSSESQASLFENAIRSELIPVCSEFKFPSVKFEAYDSLTLDPLARQSFPKLTSKNGGSVLRAVGASSDAPVGRRIAVLFSGGPASGGHNVILGLKQYLGEDNVLYGVKAGPKGLINGDLVELTAEACNRVQNLGGFDLLGSDRTKIKTDAQFLAVKKVVETFHLNGIVIIGGDDSNTNAAVLAEYLAPVGCSVIGVPKTIDGDLQFGPYLPISFGFDTATKIYAELVGNILQDTPSSRKYWHFIKVMGRSASHVALEVALQTKPALTIISEEVSEKKQSLSDVVNSIVDVVMARSKKGLNHGVVVIPEGLIEFIPEFTQLIRDLNDLLGGQSALSDTDKRTLIQGNLTPKLAELFQSLPQSVQAQLILDRDSHGNLKVSQIDTDSLLVELVQKRLMALDATIPFVANCHFFGYEGRCGAPSRFDSAYTYNLGLMAGALISAGYTGYVVSIADLDRGGVPLAIPLTALISMERRGGKDVPVIEKALVTTDSPAFHYFASRRDAWALSDRFSSPGPRQFWGPVSTQLPISVALNQGMDTLTFRFGSRVLDN